MLEDLCRLWGRPGASPREALEGGGIAAAFEVARERLEDDDPDPMELYITIGWSTRRGWIIEWEGVFTPKRRVSLHIHPDAGWLKAETGTPGASTFFGTWETLREYLPEVCKTK